MSLGTQVVSLLFLLIMAATSSSFQGLPQDEQGETEANTPDAALRNSQNPVVTDVYPTSKVLPENLLRFYVYFSKPMKREAALSFIKLVDERGKEVEGAFLANRFDLWSPDSTRLTLLFDPGRVKTGLVAHNRLGRALQANRNYELVINSKMQTIGGDRLESTYRKPFLVEEADFDAPDVEAWQVQTPRAETMDALILNLNGPQDHLSLAYRIRIKDRDNKDVPGRIELADAESAWIFKPELPWPAKELVISVDPLLEDVAGNRLTGLFEKPLDKGKRFRSEPSTITFRPLEPTDGNKKRITTPTRENNMLIKNYAEQRRPFGNPMFQIQAAWVGVNVPGSDDRGVLQLGRIDYGIIKPGFHLPMHPHETDEIFSYIRSGKMTHQDSENNLETISSNKLMMMNSGSGIQHAETVPIDSHDVEMLQIFVRPEQEGFEPLVQFHEFPSEYSIDKWRLLAGHKESGAPLIVNSQITIFDNHLTQPSEVEVEDNVQVVVYVFAGSVSVGGEETLGKGDSLVADESFRIEPTSSSADLVLFNLDELAPYSRKGSYSG